MFISPKPNNKQLQQQITVQKNQQQQMEVILIKFPNIITRFVFLVCECVYIES
jgi:polyphosphate kinase